MEVAIRRLTGVAGRFILIHNTPVMSAIFEHWQGVSKPIVGVLHVPPLPGSPQFEKLSGDMSSVFEQVRTDSDALATGQVHGLLIENFGDAPFCPGRVPAHVVANMTALTADVIRRHGDLPIGVNILRNDGQSALAVAAAVGASFIRVNVLCGARVTDQGLIEAIAYDLLRLRDQLKSEVKIFADVNVKHSRPIGQWNAQALADEVRDTIDRGLADALIVTGPATGAAVDKDELNIVGAQAAKVPVFIGSGATEDSIAQLAPYANGFIIGSAFRQDGKAGRPVETERVRSLVEAASKL